MTAPDFPAPRDRAAEILAGPWCWRRFGGPSSDLFLVTQFGGAMAVLIPSSRHARPAINVRDSLTGVLRPIAEDDPVARLVAAAPTMRDLVRRGVQRFRALDPDLLTDDDRAWLQDADAALLAVEGLGKGEAT